MADHAEQSKYGAKLQGANILILGGTSGIGYGIAEAALEFGAVVAVSSSSEKRVNGVVEKLKQEYPSRKGDVRGHVCHWGREETLGKNIVGLLEWAVQETGRKIDHIVSTAGGISTTAGWREQPVKEIMELGPFPVVSSVHSVVALISPLSPFLLAECDETLLFANFVWKTHWKKLILHRPHPLLRFPRHSLTCIQVHEQGRRILHHLHLRLGRDKPNSRYRR